MDFGDPETGLAVTAARRFWPQSRRELGQRGALRLSLAPVRLDLLKSAWELV
jgi:hypothetical protein